MQTMNHNIKEDYNLANLCLSIKFVLCNLNLKSIPTVKLVRKDYFNNRIIQRGLKPELTRTGGKTPTSRSSAGAGL